MTTAAIAILERLVAYDTVSTKSNLALVDWVADYLDGCGVAGFPVAEKHRDFARFRHCCGPFLRR